MWINGQVPVFECVHVRELASLNRLSLGCITLPRSQSGNLVDF